MEGYQYHIEGEMMYIGIKTLLLIAKGYGDFYVPACDTDTPDAQIKK